jgi:hypothetical protein
MILYSPAGDCGLAPARIIHERFCCNHGFAAATRLRLAGSPLAPLDVLLGTGALLFGACPRLGSKTGTAKYGEASPLGSACPSRNATARFRHEPS